ncbi:MAG: amino acid ABC transporter permease [Candidatus Bipolaricaulota bacterium]
MNEIVEFFRFMYEIGPQLMHGTGITLELTAICITSGFVIGLALALGRVYGNIIVYAVTTTYVELIRGTPLLVQLFIIYYGLPDVGILLQPLLAAGIALGLNTSAYQAEYFRGAIQSVGAGQMTAARSIGMSKVGAIKSVILPQALRIAIPSWSNELIYMLKYTSLAFTVGAPELMAKAKIIAARNFRYLEVFIIAALIYIVIVTLFTKVLDIIEERVKIPGLEGGR